MGKQITVPTPTEDTTPVVATTPVEGTTPVATDAELSQLADAKQAETQTEEQNGSEIAKSEEKTASESTEAKTEEKTEEQTEAESEEVPMTGEGVVHVVKYIGSGVWIDKNNVTWANGNNSGFTTTKQFTDDEYNDRDDIKFMVAYGEMEHTLVNL